MNRRASNCPRSKRGSAFATAAVLWFALCGCFLIPSPNDDPPEANLEGCSDDHTDYWAPEADDAVDIVVDSGVADQDCNELFWHSGGGGQSADTFHIEPRLRIRGDGRDLGSAPSVTWDVYDIDGDDVLFSQGFEIYESDLRTFDGGVEHRAAVFIGLDERGKNLRLVATTYLPTEGGTEVMLQPEAAVYVSEPAP